MRGRSGNSMVLALIAIVVVGGMSAATWNRVIKAEKQQNRAKERSRSSFSLEAAIQLSLGKIQRVGSATSDETTSSLLDQGTSNVNGTDVTDGTFQWTVRSANDASKQRKISATGTYNGHTFTRTKTITIVPRAFRYALLADGAGAASSDAIVLSGSAQLLAPPAYVNAAEARGGDISANASMSFASGTGVNSRSGAGSTLYDQLFLPTGATATTSASNYYGGVNWGRFTSKLTAASATYSTISVGGVATTNFPTGAVNMDGAPTNLATQTGLPVYTSIFLAGWRNLAANSTLSNPANPNSTHALYDPAGFQAALNTASPVTFNGMVFVDCRADPGTTITLKAGSLVIVENGSLIIQGCDLEVPATATLVVNHPLTDYTQPGDCSSPTPSPACSNQWPGLMLLSYGVGTDSSVPDTYGKPLGGKLTSHANASNAVDIDGLLFTDRSVSICPSGCTTNPTGNLRVTGAAVVGNKFSMAGSALAVLRWNPLVQRTDFDPSGNNMGTYSYKTADRPLPGIPTVTLTSGPTGTVSATSASFGWSSTGDVDHFLCSLDSATPTVCTSPKAYSGLSLTQHSFVVQACNPSGCGSATRDWTVGNPPDCDWTYSGSSPTNAADLSFALNCTVGVTGLASGDISNRGTAAGCTYTITGSGTAYTVQAQGCGSGTVQLRLAADSVTDGSGTTAPAAARDSSVVTIDRTGPVATWGYSGSNPSGSGSLSFALSFDETVTGLTTGDISNIGSSTGCTYTITGTGPYTVTTSGCSSGNVQLRLAAAAVKDSAGNDNAVKDSSSVTVDRTGPVATWGYSGSDPSSSGSLSFSLSFDETVTGLTSGDISNLGTATGCTYTVTGTGPYTVATSSCSSGTVQLRLAANGVTDALGNGNLVKDSSSVTVQLASPPANTAVPTITGLEVQGQTLTCNNGTWSGSPTGYTYQWYRYNGTAAATALGTSQTHTLTAADRGFKMDCDVTATNGAGSTAASSAYSARVEWPRKASAGGFHACWVKAGKVACSGDNRFGALGDGSSSGHGTCSTWNGSSYVSTDCSLSPVYVSGISTAISVTTGEYTGCALLDNGSVKCWGTNWADGVGDGSGNVNHFSPVTVISSGALKIEAGHRHICAIVDASGANQLRCWGSNAVGELGLGTNPPVTPKLTPQTVNVITGTGAGSVANADNVVDVSAGQYATCARTWDGTTSKVYCWGENGSGQLGDGTTTDRTTSAVTPISVADTTNSYLGIYAGYTHTCAITNAGKLQCWGRNQMGQLGVNNQTNTTAPGTAVKAVGNASADLTGVTDVVAGENNTCALVSSGAVDCWGQDSNGESGTGTASDYSSPHLIPVAASVSSITDLGGGGTMYSAGNASSVWKSWGWMSTGQLGIGTNNASNPTPTTVTFP